MSVILIQGLLAKSAKQIVPNKPLPTLTCSEEQNNIFSPGCLGPAPDTNTSSVSCEPRREPA